MENSLQFIDFHGNALFILYVLLDLQPIINQFAIKYLWKKLPFSRGHLILLLSGMKRLSDEV